MYAKIIILLSVFYNSWHVLIIGHESRIYCLTFLCFFLSSFFFLVSHCSRFNGDGLLVCATAAT